jgi:hypothetical protein
MEDTKLFSDSEIDRVDVMNDHLSAMSISNVPVTEFKEFMTNVYQYINQHGLYVSEEDIEEIDDMSATDEEDTGVNVLIPLYFRDSEIMEISDYNLSVTFAPDFTDDYMLIVDVEIQYSWEADDEISDESVPLFAADVELDDDYR